MRWRLPFLHLTAFHFITNVTANDQHLRGTRAKLTRILFVDDHEGTRFLVKVWLDFFKRMRWERGRVGLVSVGGSEPFDLYLLDTRMTDGAARIVTPIREFDRTKPIIFIPAKPRRLCAGAHLRAQD